MAIYGVKNLVISELSKVIHNDPDVLISTPQTGLELGNTLDEIKEFRKQQLATRAPYLFDSFQCQLEEALKLDERSLHIYARYQGNIIGSVRLTSAPFEFSGLSDDLKDLATQFADYIEISRLIVNESTRGLGVGKKLCYAAMIALHQHDKKGFVSIARLETAVTYIRFGLSSYDKQGFEITSRSPGNYQLMWGSWNMQLRGVLMHYAPRKLQALFNHKPRYQRLRDLQQREESAYG